MLNLYEEINLLFVCKEKNISKNLIYSQIVVKVKTISTNPKLNIYFNCRTSSRIPLILKDLSKL